MPLFLSACPEFRVRCAEPLAYWEMDRRKRLSIIALE